MKESKNNLTDILYPSGMNEREFYLIKRKRKKIRLREISEYIGCSIAHLSKFECGIYDMNPKYVRLYKEFIDCY
jgi:hypothetical protein